MNKLHSTLCLLLASCTIVSASKNGGYYTCNATILASDNKCIFALSGNQPEDWIQEAVKHNVDRTVGENFHRGVMSYNGTMLPVTPKPWANGDVLVGTTESITGDAWSGYALIFELVAPLRDMMMYDQDAITNEVDGEATWLKWTKAFTDCNVKTKDAYGRSGGGTPWSTTEIYEHIKNPRYKDIHHYILQYLEEGIIELVCLSTDLEMGHCDVIRETAGAVKGVDRCNCWFDAYKAIYGECPVVDVDFTVCPNTCASADCTDEEPGDTTEEERMEESSSGDVTSAAPPTGEPTEPSARCPHLEVSSTGSPKPKPKPKSKAKPKPKSKAKPKPKSKAKPNPKRPNVKPKPKRG